MKIDWALLAVSALPSQEGLCGVLGAGADTFPALETADLVLPPGISPPPGAITAIRFFVVMRLLVARIEMGKPHAIEVAIQTVDGTTALNLGAVIVPAPNPGLPPGWDQGALVPLEVAFNPPSFGHYSVEITLDTDHKKSIPFRVVKSQPPPQMQQLP